MQQSQQEIKKDAKYQINDIRTMKEFSGATFSGYKKADVTKSFMTALGTAKIEDACHWSAELLCTGAVVDIWNCLFEFYCKYIHVGNIRIALYLEQKHRTFMDIITTEHKHTPLQMRNDYTIRTMLAEIICVFSEATRRLHPTPIKIVQADFELEHIRARFMAPDTSYASEIVQKHDPIEFIIPINEFAYHISQEGGNLAKACYWIEWIYGFLELSRQKTPPTVYECVPRDFARVDTKYRADVVWMIWDAIFVELDVRSDKLSPLIRKVVYALLHMYSFHFGRVLCKRRKYILYFIVGLLCDSAAQHQHLIAVPIIAQEKYEKAAAVIRDIDLIYRQIKAGEHSAGSEYLLMDTGGGSKTI